MFSFCLLGMCVQCRSSVPIHTYSCVGSAEIRCVVPIYKSCLLTPCSVDGCNSIEFRLSQSVVGFVRSRMSVMSAKINAIY